MFDLEQFIADCREAVAGDPSHKAVREVVARTVSDPAGVLAGLGEPQRAGITRGSGTPGPSLSRVSPEKLPLNLTRLEAVIEQCGESPIGRYLVIEDSRFRSGC